MDKRIILVAGIILIMIGMRINTHPYDYIALFVGGCCLGSIVDDLK